MAELVIRRDCLQTQYSIEKLGDHVALNMIRIPAGTFEMGSPTNEEGRFDRESPQHVVKVSAFFLGRYPITNSQWNFVSQLPRQKRSISASAQGTEENHPVVEIAWSDAVEFCDRLSSYTGRPYRLPTEAEWEYACRAGTTTPFYYGETISPELANYDSDYSYNNGPTGDSPRGTTPVGQYESANRFGLSDMHGNVWEWCQDNWHDTYQGAPANGSAWGNDEDSYHVCRGGSWLNDPGLCRSASRLDGFIVNVGFRVACSAPRT